MPLPNPVHLVAETKVDAAFVILAAVSYGGMQLGGRIGLPALAQPLRRPPLRQPAPPFLLTPGSPFPPHPPVFFFSMGSAFLPGHAAWATLLLWVASQIGALIAWQLRLPRVIGMLLAGMFMQVGVWGCVGVGGAACSARSASQGMRAPGLPRAGLPGRPPGLANPAKHRL